MDDNKDAKNKTPDKKQSWLKRLPLWQKIVGGLAVVAIVLIIVVNLATSGVAKASNEFLKDWQNQNATAAYSLLTKDAAAVTDQTQFKNMVDRVGPILDGQTNMKSKEASGETGSAAKGKVVYEVKGTDGLTYTVTINLQKEDGKWKVLNFESTQKK